MRLQFYHPNSLQYWLTPPPAPHCARPYLATSQQQKVIFTLVWTGTGRGGAVSRNTCQHIGEYFKKYLKEKFTNSTCCVFGNHVDINKMSFFLLLSKTLQDFFLTDQTMRRINYEN